MADKKAHVSDTKKKLVKSLANAIKEYPVVGAVDLEGMPASQLSKMRATLRKNDISLVMTKRRLIQIAIQQAKADKAGIEELEKSLTGMPALIFSKVDPFKLYKLLKQSKSPAPAKGGQIAPKDIEVKAGPTNFLPGPIIGELGAFGIKSGVEDGKVAIKEDSIVCKEGEVIDGKLAEVLTRLDIKPMEIGLNLTAAYDQGTIFKKNVLDVDEEQFIANITQAAQESFNLSVETGYITKDNVDVIIQNVFYSCKALAEESGFLADVVVEDMLATAETSAKSVKATANISDEAPKEEKKEEAPVQPKAEEKPAEPKKEEPVKEESKVEEKPVEEPKKEEPKAAEPPKEEPKVEEKPKEEPKKEEPKQEEKKEEPESPKEKSEPSPKQETQSLNQQEEKVLEEEKEIIEEEKKIEQTEPNPNTDPVTQEVQEAAKEEKEKQLEKERIEKEKQVEKIEEKKEEVKEASTDDAIQKMVQQQKKHDSGEDKKESAEALVEEAKKDNPNEKIKKEHEAVEDMVSQLQKGKELSPKKDGDDVPSLAELAARKKK